MPERVFFRAQHEVSSCSSTLPVQPPSPPPFLCPSVVLLPSSISSAVLVVRCVPLCLLLFVFRCTIHQQYNHKKIITTLCYPKNILAVVTGNRLTG